MASVFFDIDGTLWDREKVIPQSTREGIAKLRENGHKAFISSGRTHVMIQDESLLSLGFDGISAGCGTEIIYQDQSIFLEEIAVEHLTKTVNMLRDYQMPVMLEGSEYVYMEDDLLEDLYGKIVKSTLGDKVKSIVENEGNWHVSKFCVPIKDDRYIEVKEQLEALDYNVMVHGKFVMEVVPDAFSKASGIETACKHLDLSLEETYAFGDSVNDCDMLSFAAHGIAMGNGTEPAKAAADYVTSDLHEDGIYNGLKHFGLI